MFTYINKDIYSGQWKNGKKHGQGTYVFIDTGMRVYLWRFENWMSLFNFSWLEIGMKINLLKENGSYQMEIISLAHLKIINQMEKVKLKNVI